ncbi:MAG: hypothetical protein AAB402_01170 [Patescibacteria group bacterium]
MVGSFSPQTFVFVCHAGGYFKLKLSVPSTYIFQSFVASLVVFVFVATFVFPFAIGQAANPHFGGTRPTDDPSGQTFASMMHATSFVSAVLLFVTVFFGAVIAKFKTNKNAATDMTATTTGIRMLPWRMCKKLSESGRTVRKKIFRR